MNERRERTLTDADILALKELLICDKVCSFTQEEVQFVRDWLETAKTAKSEVVRWVVRMGIVAVGIFAGIQVAFKMGFFKITGK